MEAVRAMLPSALSVSPLVGGSVHYEIRVSGRRCNLTSGLSFKRGQVGLRSHRDPKRRTTYISYLRILQLR
jgi:hypothetical protein